MLSATHFHIREHLLNKLLGCCWTVQVCSVAPKCTVDDSGGLVALSGMNTDVDVHLRPKRMALLKERIKPVKRHESVFIKRGLVYIFGYLRGPHEVLVLAVYFKIIN